MTKKISKTISGTVLTLGAMAATPSALLAHADHGEEGAESSVATTEGVSYVMEDGEGMMGDFGFYGGAMWLFWIAVVGLIAAAIYRLVNKNDAGAGKSASQLLDDRYASGEIDKKEYDQKKKDLNK